MSIMIFARAIKRNPETGELQSYWPERASLEYLAKEYADGSMASFSASYMLDAQAAAGRLLQRDWLQFYLPEELESYRLLNHVERGAKHAGADLGGGGQGVHADFMAVVGIERINNRGFLTDFYMKRHDLSGNKERGIDSQAEVLEKQLDLIAPNTTIIEDIASKGYVFKEMTSVINEEKGSKHLFRIEKPQSKAAGGDKATRFKGMAPRFTNGSIMLPGRIGAHDSIMPARWIQPLVDQWTAFPGGHDDGLDALYWAQYAAFGTELPVSVSKDEHGHITSHSAYTESSVYNDEPDPNAVCVVRQHRDYGKPRSVCFDCGFMDDLRGYTVSGIDKTNPGAYSKAREVAASRPRYGLSTHRR